MKLRLEQLEQHLKQSLLPCYLITSDELYLVEQTLQKFRDAAKIQGFVERKVFHADTHFDWQSLLYEAQSLSLFATQELIEVRIPNGKFSDAAKKALTEYWQTMPSDKILVLITSKLSSTALKAKWLSRLEKQGAILQIWPIESSQLPQWIAARLKQQKVAIDRDAAELLAQRNEGNLLALAQECDALALLFPNGDINLEAIIDVSHNSARYDVFQLGDSVLAGDAKRVLRMLQGLKAEGIEPTLVLWSLAREVRSLASMAWQQEQGEALDVVMNKAKVWARRKSLMQQALRRGHSKKWQRLLSMASDADAMIKGVKPGNVWLALERLALGAAS